LKLKYFYELDRSYERPLVLWGAGRNGKFMAKLLLEHEKEFFWVCDNPKKIGKHVYGIIMEKYNSIPEIENPQIMIVVTSTGEKAKIREQLISWGKIPVEDFWFFI
jgi:hypothetical protein